METKLLTKRAHIVANNLFFENSIIVSFTNYAWGIWVLWNSHQISLSQIQVTSRSIHALVTLNQGVPPFLMFAVYNYPQMHI